MFRFLLRAKVRFGFVLGIMSDVYLIVFLWLVCELKMMCLVVVFEGRLGGATTSMMSMLF